MAKRKDKDEKEEIKIIMSEADLRFFDDTEYDMEMTRLKPKNSRISSNGVVFNDDYGKQKANRIVGMEKKLQKEIQIAHKVLQKNDNINEMFQYSDDESANSNDKSKKPSGLSSNAAKDILAKYGRLNPDDDKNDKNSLRVKKSARKKSITAEDYGVPAADMIIEKYPKKKKSSLNAVGNKKTKKATTKGTSEIGVQHDENMSTDKEFGRENSTVQSGNAHNKDDKNDNGDKTNSGDNDNERRNPDADNADGSKSGTKKVKGQKFVNENDVIEPRKLEDEYDGFDSDEEAKFNSKNKSKVQKVSKEIFSDKYANNKNSTTNNKRTDSGKSSSAKFSGRNPQTSAEVRKSFTDLSEKNIPRSVTNSAKRSNSLTNDKNYREKEKTSENQASRPHTAVKNGSKIPSQQISRPSSVKNESESQSKDDKKNNEPRLPSPKQNPHYATLINSDDEESEESASDPEIVITNYLQVRKEEKETRKAKN